MKNKFLLSVVSCLVSAGAVQAVAAPVYLNESNISVVIGPNTSAGSWNNTFNGGATINKVIDAPTAATEEFHNQATHIWFTADEVGGGIELLFDFGIEYDLHTLHFWNYTSEDYDVDNIDFTLYNGANVQVGTLPVLPDLGSPGGIEAQDIALVAPLNVRYVTAFLSGSNRQVDFQNIGFTADVSTPVDPPTPAPAPATFVLFVLSLLGLKLSGRRVER